MGSKYVRKAAFVSTNLLSSLVKTDNLFFSSMQLRVLPRCCI